MLESRALTGDLAILVVDDDHPSAKLIEAALADHPSRVVSVTTAEEALLRLPELKPGLVLLDLELPGMNGLELARVIRARPDSRDTALVLISSCTGPELRHDAAHAGCSACIHKPIDPVALPAVLAQLVNARAVGSSHPA